MVKGMLHVEPIAGEPYRYQVSSSRAGEAPYLVDIEARFPMARCQCKGYECKRWPEFKKTLIADHCPHVRSALLYHALRHIRNTSTQLKGDGE